MNLKDSYKKLNADMIKRAMSSNLGRQFDSQEQKEMSTKKEIDLLILAYHTALEQLKQKEEKYNKHLDRLENLYTIYDNKIWKNRSIWIDEEIKKLDKKLIKRSKSNKSQPPIFSHF